MGLNCMVRGCDGRQHARGTVSVHAFPKEKRLSDQWEKFIQKIDVNFVHRPGSRYGICSKHFEEKCFRNLGQFQLGYATVLHLLKNAVPTKYPDFAVEGTTDDLQEVANVPTLFQMPETMSDIEKTTGPRKYDITFPRKRIAKPSELAVQPVLKKVVVIDTNEQKKFSNAKKGELPKLLPKPTSPVPVWRISPSVDVTTPNKIPGQSKRKSIEHVAMLIKRKKCSTASQTEQSSVCSSKSASKPKNNVDQTQPIANGITNGFKLLPVGQTLGDANEKSGIPCRTWVLLPNDDESNPAQPQENMSQEGEVNHDPKKGKRSVRTKMLESTEKLDELGQIEEHCRDALRVMYDMQTKSHMCDLFFHVPRPTHGGCGKKRDVKIGVHRNVFAALSKKVANYKDDIMLLNTSCREQSVSKVVEFAYTGEIASIAQLTKWGIISIYVAAASLGVTSCVKYIHKKMPGIVFPESLIKAILCEEKLEAGNRKIFPSWFDRDQSHNEHDGLIETEIITDFDNDGEYLDSGLSGSILETVNGGDEPCENMARSMEHPCSPSTQLDCDMTYEEIRDIAEHDCCEQATQINNTGPADEQSSLEKNRPPVPLDKSESSSAQKNEEHPETNCDPQCAQTESSQRTDPDLEETSDREAPQDSDECANTKHCTNEDKGTSQSPLSDDWNTGSNCNVLLTIATSESAYETLSPKACAKMEDSEFSDEIIEDTEKGGGNSADSCIYIELEVSDMSGNEMSDEFSDVESESDT